MYFCICIYWVSNSLSLFSLTFLSILSFIFQGLTYIKTMVLNPFISLCVYVMGIGSVPSTHTTGTILKSCILLSHSPWILSSRLYTVHGIPTTSNDPGSLGVHQTSLWSFWFTYHLHLLKLYYIYGMHPFYNVSFLGILQSLGR